MEFAARGRSAADGAGDGRRFPDPPPPPPHGRDAHSAPANMAALVFRRGELLHEFHRERIRLDTILCDLAETERAMTVCLAMPSAGWGPYLDQCEGTLCRNPRGSSEDNSWWRRNPSELVIPPVYPHVERSPSPARQQWPVDDSEQHECGGSSGALAVAPSCPDVEQCWSLRKEPAVDALVQAAINVVANPMEPALFSEKVTLESRAAVNQEQEQHLKDSHGVQLTESGIQISEQPKCPAIGEERKAEAKKSHESELPGIEHPMHAAAGQEREAEAKDSHPVQLMECDVQRSQQLNRAAIGQGRETNAIASHAVQVMESKFQNSEQVKRGAVGQENKDEVKDNHEVLMESKAQRSEQPKHEASGQEHKAEENDRHAAQPMEESGMQSSEQPKPAEPTISECIDEPRQLPHQYALAGKEKSPPNNEQKRQVFDDPKTQITPCGVKRKRIVRINRHKPLEEQSCTLGVNLTCEEDLTQHPAGELHRSNLEVLLSRQGVAELTAKSTPVSSHRPRLRPISNNDMESEIQRSEQSNCSALGQECEAEAKNSHTMQLMENKIQRRQTTREAFGEECKAEEKDRHAEQLMESGIQNRERSKSAEPTFRDGMDERRQSPLALPVKEKPPSNGHRIVVFNKTTPSGVKRPILRPAVTTPPPKRHKPLGEWSCALCQENLTCEEDLTQHKAGELHQSNLAALRARHEASGFDLRHGLRSRSLQESAQTLCTEEGGYKKGKCAVDRGGEDPKKKIMSNRQLPFCKLCKVQCPCEKAMQLHLAGKKHRGNLQARH